MEKLSPILAFYVADGLVEGAKRSYEILRYGGMGHTAGTHTRSREAAVKFGAEMPASRITVNTPTTHGAIGFSTALPPSMTLGCGSWGGNVTSDNVSPLHLLDIKRVAFETRPVKSARPGVSSTAGVSAPPPSAQPSRLPQPAAAQSGKINREEIAAIVDKFLANRRPEDLPQPGRETAKPAVEVEAGSMYAGPGRNASEENGQNAPARAASPPAASSANGNKTVDFVSEDDVKRAIQKGEKIYINGKTIITPAARDIGEPAEVFAKG
jgi:acetaldehyde dehydrogenase (acetylating)